MICYVKTQVIKKITFNISKQDECYNTSNVSGYGTNNGAISTDSLSIPENYRYNFAITFHYGDHTLTTEYVIISKYNNVFGK